MNAEQQEAHAVDVLKCYTPDIYIGPDITQQCMNQMVDQSRDDMVYLEPVQGTKTRVIVGLLTGGDHVEKIAEISKQLIPLCYVINYQTSSGVGVAVKWTSLMSESV